MAKKKYEEMENPGSPEDAAMDAAMADEGPEMAPEEELAAADAEVADSRQDALAAAAPPAVEELTTDSMSTMGDAITSTVGVLSNGELPPQQIEQQLAVPDQPQPQVPPGIWSAMTAIEQAMQGVPEAEKYMFRSDVAATTNEEMVNASVAIHNLGRDQAAVQAIQRAGAAQSQAPQAAPAAPMEA